MILKVLKRNFFDALIDLYPETEVDAFFNLLSESILEMKRVDISLNPCAEVSEKEHSKFLAAIERLKSNEPIQYIIGNTEFYGSNFKVDKGVLIPRPETEELVDLVITNVKSRDLKPKTFQILDIGTGSGCIAISLAKKIVNAEVYALDVSKNALKTAKQNAILNNVDVTFFETDILDETAFDLSFRDLKFDTIVSNPPYVRYLEKAQMEANVLDYEPHLALFVEDNNPLQFYTAIVKFALRYLKDNGNLFFEINEYQGKEMIALLKHYKFKFIELIRDLSGKDRILKATL